MPTDILLKPRTHRVLERVPFEWWNEAEAEREIANELGFTLTSVRSLLRHLLKVGLIERRRRQSIAPPFEVRRIAKG